MAADAAKFEFCDRSIRSHGICNVFVQILLVFILYAFFEYVLSSTSLAAYVHVDDVLYEALIDLVSRVRVDVNLLHSLVSVWIWEVLLAWDVSSIAYSVFKFIERYEGQVVAWWPSVAERSFAWQTPYAS